MADKNDKPRNPTRRHGKKTLRTGIKVQAGQRYKFVLAVPIKARWDREEAREGEEVHLLAEISGAADGSPAKIHIQEWDHDGKHDSVARLEATVQGGKLDSPWSYVYVDDDDDEPLEPGDEEAGKLNHPELFFEVEVGKKKGTSALLKFKEDVCFTLSDEDGQPMADRPFVITLPDGSHTEGSTDAEGKAWARDMPPGPVSISYPEEEWAEVL